MDNPYYEILMNAALRFVSFRPRSEKELRDFLSKKLIRFKVSGAGLLEKIISRMRELGYVDDTKFARWWLDQRMRFKPKGNRAILVELTQKGVSREIISSVLALQGPESLLEAARYAIAGKLPSWLKLGNLERKKKMYDFLLRRGFDADTIRRVE